LTVRLVYQVLVLYIAGHAAWYLFREKSVGKQAGAALVLILLLLRLALVK
jgi:hypothetical protein